MAKSVLLIVEGERAEKRLMEALFDMFFPQTSAKVYSYCTTLHELAGSLFVDGMMDEDLDILQVLRESVSGRRTVVCFMQDIPTSTSCSIWTHIIRNPILTDWRR